MDIAIYQVNMGRDHNRVAFQSLDGLERFQSSSEIESEIYDKVFEGEVSCENLEDVYRMFNIDHPKGYKGRSLSVSDVVEVIGADGESTYNFCDRHFIFCHRQSSQTPERTIDMARMKC